MESICKHCKKRIVLVNFALRSSWRHQPSGAAFSDGMYVSCQLSVAEPVDISDIDMVDWDMDANLPMYTRDYLRMEKAKEVDQLHKQIEFIKSIHLKMEYADGSGHGCTSCSENWPCRTITTLTRKE